MANQLTDIQIAVRIVPTYVRWPETNTGIWKTLRNCVDSLRKLVRGVND